MSGLGHREVIRDLALASRMSGHPGAGTGGVSRECDDVHTVVYIANFTKYPPQWNKEWFGESTIAKAKLYFTVL